MGIDSERDRELLGNEAKKFNADRQVGYFIKALLPNGTLQLNTRVGDFVQNVPRGPANVRANVLARLVVNGNETWSDDDDRPAFLKSAIS